MELWNRLLELLRMKRTSGARYFALDERLNMALVERADREGRPAEDIQGEPGVGGAGTVANIR